jgi:hypothetical protein
MFPAIDTPSGPSRTTSAEPVTSSVVKEGCVENQKVRKSMVVAGAGAAAVAARREAAKQARKCIIIYNGLDCLPGCRQVTFR